MTVIKETPEPKEYCHLRKICGLSQMPEAAAKIALPRSLFSVTLRDAKQLIGMGRVVGDGGCHIQLVDIAVHPDFQKQGLAKKIMEALMGFIRKEIPPTAVVSLMADVDFLYQKYGFYYSENSRGMLLSRKENQS